MFLCIAFEKWKRFSKNKGEMAEWSIAAVLKTVELKGSWGSNPYLSANNIDCQLIAKQVHENVHESIQIGCFFMPIL